VSRLAVPLTAATLLGASPAQMGMLAASASLPALLLGLHSGAIADRLIRHRPLMIACELVSAVAAFTVPITWILGVLTIPWLIAVALTIGSCAVVFRSANFPHLAAVVPAEQLTEALAGSQASYSTASIVGPGAAGLLVQVLTAPFAVLAEGLSFVTSALLLRSIRTPGHHTPTASRGMSRDILHGLRLSVTHPVLRAVLGAGVTINFFASVALAVYVLFMIQELNVPQGLLGLLAAASGVGGVLAAMVTPRLARRFGEDRLVLWSALLFPVDMTAVALAGGPLAVTATVLVTTGLITGAVVVTFATCLGTIIMRDSPADARGRVNATMTFAIQGVMTAGGLTGGLLAEVIGVRPVIWIGAAGLALSPLWLWTSPLRRHRRPSRHPRHRHPSSPAQGLPTPDSVRASLAGVPAATLRRMTV
jgi:MFS family permease